MSNVVPYEFLGKWWYFWLLCMTGFGIPIALLYYTTLTIRVETEMESPEEFVAAWREGRINR